MSKLWHKGYQLDQLIERFTVGDDPVLDKQLIVYDCIGSIAHAHMLMSIGIISKQEFKQLQKKLLEVIRLAELERFSIEQSDEDVHTAVENYLTSHLGDVGKKLHTARSRNDQIALDMRLYMRDKLLELTEEVIVLCEKLLEAAESSKAVPIPGRTHFQRAMPSSFGLFFGAYAESLLDTVTILQNAYKLVNQSPLGSAAGYGVALPIDRQEVAQLLGCAQVQNNVVYASMSRGKIESIVLHALAQIMIDLSKLSTDVIIFSAPEFGYISIPQELCSGSSLMPQKRNPCGLELVRAKSATVMSNLMQTLMIIRALPSGYNRDYQETKQPLMESFGITRDSVRIAAHTVAHLTINTQVCIDSFSNELFATDCVMRLVQQGVPFRQAYQQVALAPATVQREDPVKNIAEKKHQGASGNLQLALSIQKCGEYHAWVEHERALYQKAIKHLLEE
jgi:argininosuccinate lyase